MPARTSHALAAALAAALLAPAQPARAESALRMEVPASFGVIPAATYDTHRERVGAAHLAVERLDDGHVRIFSDSGISGGARTVAMAELAPATGGTLQPLVQESRTFDPQGAPRGLLRLDHPKRLGTCTSQRGDGATHTLELPEHDRVANVPMNLFFLPLVRGEAERIDFQLFLCGGGPRLVDFEATRAPANGSPSSSGAVEVRYGPQLGPVLSLVAPSFLPKLSFWFDPAEPHRWLAHRLPLYSDGPEVFVIRDGVAPQALPEE